MPLVAGRDAATTVVFPIWAIGIEAAFAHVFPDVVKTCFCASMITCAATAYARAFAQFAPAHLAFGATSASAKPFLTSSRVDIAFGEDGPATESLIRDIDDRGLLMLADPRLTGRAYGQRIFASLPMMQKTRDEQTALHFIDQLALTHEPITSD